MDILQYLSAKLREEVQSLDNDIAAGKAKDFAEYKSACGVRLGLIKANGIIAEVSEKLKADQAAEEEGGTNVE